GAEQGRAEARDRARPAAAEERRAAEPGRAARYAAACGAAGHDAQAVAGTTGWEVDAGAIVGIAPARVSPGEPRRRARNGSPAFRDRPLSARRSAPRLW